MAAKTQCCCLTGVLRGLRLVDELVFELLPAAALGVLDIAIRRFQCLADILRDANCNGIIAHSNYTGIELLPWRQAVELTLQQGRWDNDLLPILAIKAMNAVLVVEIEQ